MQNSPAEPDGDILLSVDGLTKQFGSLKAK